MKRKTKKSQLNSCRAPKPGRVFTRDDFEVRPVTKEDKWCHFEEGPNIEAPYGYIVAIPNYSKKMSLSLGGIIVRTRLFKKVWYLQVVETPDHRSYQSAELKRVHTGKKKRDVLRAQRQGDVRGLCTLAQGRRTVRRADRTGAGGVRLRRGRVLRLRRAHLPPGRHAGSVRLCTRASKKDAPEHQRPRKCHQRPGHRARTCRQAGRHQHFAQRVRGKALR